jgi:hypothetical protein
MKYTYSDEEDEGYSDATTSRRSTRNTGTHTPAEGLAPTVTQSGRQVRARQGGAYGESILSGTHTPAVTLGSHDGTSEEVEQTDGGRPRRAAAATASTKGWGSKGGAHIEGYNSVDEMDSDEDDASEQDYGDDEEEDDHLSLDSDKDDVVDDADEDLDDGDEDEKKSLVIKLPVKTPTPERKTTNNLRLTPEEDQVKPVKFNPNTAGNEDKPSFTASGMSGTGSSAAVDPAINKENAEPLAFTTEPAPVAPEVSTVSISIPPKGPSDPVQATPLSPLALRGSPEKPPQRFPQSSINVGYGGS